MGIFVSETRIFIPIILLILYIIMFIIYKNRYLRQSRIPTKRDIMIFEPNIFKPKQKPKQKFKQNYEYYTPVGYKSLFPDNIMRRCADGPYMASSNNYLNQICQYYPHARTHFCSNGYRGKPIKFQYTPLSNKKWENNICSSL